MDYFSKQYKALFTLPNAAYSEVLAGLQPFFITEVSHGLSVADVVAVEPEVSKSTNDLIREQKAAGYIECEFLLITSVKPLGDGKTAHGFVRLATLPRPINNIIDALYSENNLLKAACKREGLNADLIALGVES
ncbi:hypothetical protein [Alteromonas lipotrueae]|uniref:hypothetical protein n=1 Tax=Alteromonas lipotrueae TaxID=2803814 RepID=UPI001C44FA78|nr:hypothetical protein [Alteromonas lipotrueae]